MAAYFFFFRLTNACTDVPILLTVLEINLKCTNDYNLYWCWWYIKWRLRRDFLYFLILNNIIYCLMKGDTLLADPPVPYLKRIIWTCWNSILPLEHSDVSIVIFCSCFTVMQLWVFKKKIINSKYIWYNTSSLRFSLQL